jgi:hypothetical protein
LSNRPTVTALTVADLREWYQQIQHTTVWIQLHIISHQSELYYVANLREVLVFLEDKQEQKCIQHFRFHIFQLHPF